MDSGFAPAPDPWLVWMRNMAGWLRPLDDSMASAVIVTKIKIKFAIGSDEVAVPFGNPKAIALGTVASARCTGWFQATFWSDGDGLEIIQFEANVGQVQSKHRST